MADRALSGKVAIVTGAGRLRGIGRATAVALAEIGADVVVTGTGRDPASFPPDEKAIHWRDIESTAEQVRALGVRCLPLKVDVSNSLAVQEMVDAAIKAYGRIDILVNNAAFARGPDRVPMTEMDETIFRRVIDIKTVGTFLCCRAVTRVLIAQNQGGHVINLSSTAGKHSAAHMGAYAAANASVEAMGRVLAREVAQYGITVNTVCPGPVDTSRMDDVPRGEAWDRFIKGRIPLQRAGTDEEVADLIAYLCSGKGAMWMTGQAINIDGGSVMER